MSEDPNTELNERDDMSPEEFADFIDNGPHYQQCAGPCGRNLPLEEHYFHRDNKRENGFHGRCKQCVANAREARENKRLLREVAKLDNGIIKTIRDGAMIYEGHTTTRGMMDEIMAVFGGQRGYAQHLLAHFASTKAGSMARTHVFRMIQALALHIDASGRAPNINLGLLTEEELEQELQKRLGGTLTHECPS